MITDLHRWIDLIHERGQALYSAFSELRKHLEDVQRQIKSLHKKIHDNDVLVLRLNKELDDWKHKASKLRSEVGGLQAKYLQLEKVHNSMKKDQAACDQKRYSRDSLLQTFAFIIDFYIYLPQQCIKLL